MTITYTVKNGIYINMTNRCSNSCEFCIRQNGEGVYGSDSLWLEREPTVDEIISDLKKYDLTKYEEVVFCGYGEPTERIDTLVSVAKYIKDVSNTKIRINTNGHGNLINGKDITPLFKGIVDTVSVSLNCASADDYNKICHPVFGVNTFFKLIEFTRLCTSTVPNVVMSVVDTTISKKDIKKCTEIAESVGATLRIRPFE